MFAGLFDTWKSDEGSVIYSYSVITMESSPKVNWIHERMPAILETEDEVRNWLDSAHVSSQKALSNLKPSTNVCIYPVSTQVNNVRNQDTSLNRPIDLNKPKTMSASGKFMANWLTKSKREIHERNVGEGPVEKKIKIEKIE